MSRRPPKPAPVVVKRPADQRRKLPPELEAFARSDDEKLRIRRPRVDQGRVRDPREGYTVAGVSNRDARAVYDVRTEAMRGLWAGGEADDEALSVLGQLFHEALRLELWHARRLTSFAALAEEVIGVPAAKAEALADAYAEQSGEPLKPLTERAIALWLRTEAGLYEGDENARARIVSRAGTLMLELSVELVHVSTALAGVGARHLPLARSREADDGERRHGGRDTHERRPRDDERPSLDRGDERQRDARQGGWRADPARSEPGLRSLPAPTVEKDDLDEPADGERVDRAAFEDAVEDEAVEGAAFEDAVEDEATDQGDAGVEDGVDEDDGVEAQLDDDGDEGSADEDTADEIDADADPRARGQGLDGTRLLTRKSRLEGARVEREPAQHEVATLGQRAAAVMSADRPRFNADERRDQGRSRPAFGDGESRGQSAERARAGGLDRSAVDRSTRSGGAASAERPRFGAERGSFGGGKERPRFAGNERAAGGAERPRFGGGNRQDGPRFGADRAAAGGTRFGADRGGNREERPRFGNDRGASGPRFGADRGGNREERPRFGGNREDRPRFGGGERGAGGARFGADRGAARGDRPRFAGGGKERNAAGREDRPRFGNDRGRAPGAREDRPRFGNDRGRTTERPKQGGFGDRRDAPQSKFGGKAKPGGKGGKGFGARQPFGQKDKVVEGRAPREPRRSDDDDNLE